MIRHFEMYNKKILKKHNKIHIQKWIQNVKCENMKKYFRNFNNSVLILF